MKPLTVKWNCVALLVFCCNNFVSECQRDYNDIPEIPVGLIIHEGLEDLIDAQNSFKHAVKQLRTQRQLNFKFNNTIKSAFFNDSFNLMKEVCEMLSSGVFSLIVHGPATSYEVINSVADKMKIPTFFPTGTGYIPSNTDSYVINMMPSYTDAMIDLIHFFRWDTVYYLFDSKEGLIRLQDLYKASGGNYFRFTIRPRRISNISDCYELLRSLDRQNSYKIIAGERCRQQIRIILDLSSRKAYNLTLEQIINVGMNRENYHYILGGLGIYEDKQYLKSFEYGGVNITGFSVIDKAKYRTQPGSETYNVEPIKYKEALMMDTVNFIAEGYKKLKEDHKMYVRSMYRSGKIWNGATPGLNCSGQPWDMGEKLDKIYKSITMEGLSGTVNFNSYGLREVYTLEVYQLEYKKPLRKIGIWTPKGPTLKTRFQTELLYPTDEDRNVSLVNKTLRIVTILEKPFVQKVTGNDNGENVGHLINGTRYEGYCIDLIDKVQKRYKMMFEKDFNYEIHLVYDGNFGKVNLTDGKWNGMIGELIYGKADMAVASLTINKERERAVDFTKPFMNMGVSIMIKKPDKEKPGVFSFMYPLSNEVWMCVMFAFLAVSFVLFFVGRWSPYEWQTTPTTPKDEATTNAFTFSNTLWFALGALMQQGSDIFPRSFSGRVVGSAWWFFTLILISSYTANLAAFLTIERLLTPIKSADDLVEQSEIAYGTYAGGATQRFFEESQVIIYRNMWKYMQANKDSVMMSSNEVGINKVRTSKSKYAFLVESPLNEYQNQKKPCDTMKVGDNLDSKGYGIATPLHSPLRKDLNLVVLDLREQGELHKLLQRWWYDKGECGSVDSSDGVKSALTLSNVSGIFHILIGGLVLSMIVALLEFLILKKRKQRKQQQQYYKPAAVKIVKKDPLEVLKAAGYTEHENSGYTYSPPDHMKSFDSSYSPNRSHTAI